MSGVVAEGIGLPVTIEDITPRWLTQALSQRYPGVEVVSARVREVLWGTATKIRLAVEYNGNGQAAGLPPSLLVKGGFADHREMMSYIYDMEVRFFRDILPQLELNAPQCYFAGNDPDRNQHLLILEDLDLRKVTFCRVQRPLTFEQTAAFLDVQARYHARWWDSSVFQPGGNFDWLDRWDPLPDGEEGIYQWGQLKPEVWERYMKLPRGVAVPKLIHDRDQMERALLRLKEFDRTGPDCFIHGDPHLGNLYLQHDGSPGFLDWQSYRKGPWHHDVTYFMVSALDIVDRRKWDRALLSYYLERLATYGVQNLPSFDKAWDAFRRQIIDGLYFWLVNPVEWQAEENNCAVAPRFAMAAIDLDTFELMG